MTVLGDEAFITLPGGNARKCACGCGNYAKQILRGTAFCLDCLCQWYAEDTTTPPWTWAEHERRKRQLEPKP